MKKIKLMFILLLVVLSLAGCKSSEPGIHNFKKVKVGMTPEKVFSLLGEYDDVDTEKWYGIDVYLGYNSYEIIKVGNLVRLVGTLSYYETGQRWQLTGLSYHRMNPDYEGSMKLLDKNVEVTAHNITSADLSSTANNDGIIPGDDIQSVYVKIEPDKSKRR